MALNKVNPDKEVVVVPNLLYYDWIVINSSGGKDSSAAMDVTIKRAKEQGFPLDRIVVAHAKLEEEWAGTAELVAEHAAHYGLAYFEFKRPQGSLLKHVEERGMWPSNSQRYCTSDHKRGQIAKLFTQLTHQTRSSVSTGYAANRKGKTLHPKKVRILNVFGFRKEESPARRKMVEFEKDRRLTNTLRHVDRWLPIHHFKERQVWQQIKKAGTRIHWAYSRGMSRLSCCFCIFAPRSQLIVAASQPENKELFNKYVQLETKLKHKFRQNQSLAEIKEAIDNGEQPNPEGEDEAWNM